MGHGLEAFRTEEGDLSPAQAVRSTSRPPARSPPSAGSHGHPDAAVEAFDARDATTTTTTTTTRPRPDAEGGCYRRAVRLIELDLEAFAGMPFPVATRAELARAGRIACRAMGRALVVLWNGGRPRAYLDRCPHLGLPLSLGRVEGDALRCAYHGWSFATDDGAVREQPTLPRPVPCHLERFGALVAGGLVFAWLGDPTAEAAARAALPSDVVDDFVLHRVEFAAPFYLALYSAVDYAHFARHRGYAAIYAAYRRLRRDAHVPGRPFRWTIVGEDEHRIAFRLEEARRDLELYATCADFRDEGGVNRFQTFVTPIAPDRTLYWECYQPRSDHRLVRWAAAAAFRAVVAPLLDGEDRAWVGAAAAAFAGGEGVHPTANDLPLTSHLRKFVRPRLKAS
jgi:phenylpropionate dioxygenase-like ring-hydroxylating dioxygenase large terminal subunit